MIRSKTGKVSEIIPLLHVDAGQPDPKSDAYSETATTLQATHKEEQRVAVMKHFREHLGTSPLHLFGFPGEAFGFENLCVSKWGTPVSFVGCEYSPSLLHNSLIHAPGTRMKAFGESGLHGWSNSLGVVFCASLMEFLCRDCGNGRRSKQDRKLWAQNYKRNNAVWLDWTCNLCDSMADALMRIGTICHDRVREVPFCITFSYGRESGIYMDLINHHTMPFISPEMRRVAVIENWLNEGRFRTFQRTNVQIWPSSRSDNGYMVLLSGVLEAA